MNNNLSSKSFTTILLLATLATTFFFSPTRPQIAKAQSSPEPDPATESANIDTDSIRENIKERIKQAVESNSTDALTITAMAPKAWVGTVESISNSTISIISDSSTRLVSVSENTTIVKDQSPLDLEDLEIDSAVIAMGTIDDNEILEAKRIVNLEELPQKSLKQTILIDIDDIDTKTNTIFFTFPGQDQSDQVEYSRLTDFTDLNIANPTSIDATDLNPGDSILIIHQPGSTDPSIKFTPTVHRTHTTIIEKTTPPEDDQE